MFTDLLEQPSPAIPLAARVQQFATLLYAEAAETSLIYDVWRAGHVVALPQMSEESARWILRCAEACGLGLEREGEVRRIV